MGLATPLKLSNTTCFGMEMKKCGTANKEDFLQPYLKFTLYLYKIPFSQRATPELKLNMPF